MDGLLSAAKSVNKNGENQQQPHFNLVETRTLHRNQVTKEHIQETLPSQSKPSQSKNASPATIPSRPDEALRTLRSEPDVDTLLTTLKLLSSPNGFGDGFNLASPGPLQAQIINTLVSSIVLVYWSTFEKSDKRLLVDCLTSVAGVGAVVAKTKFLVSQSRVDKTSINASSIQELLEVLEQLLKGDDRVATVRNRLCQSTEHGIKRDLTWKEFVNVAASGRITSTAAEAEDAVQAAELTVKPSWLASGPECAAWLGNNVAFGVHNVNAGDGIDGIRPYGLLLARAFSIGYPIPLVRSLHIELLRKSSNGDDGSLHLKRMLSSLPRHNKRHYLDHTLRWLASVASWELASDGKGEPRWRQEASAMSALLRAVVDSDSDLQNHLLAILGDPALLVSLPLPLRRACLAAIQSTFPDELDSLIEKLMATFGDQLFIKHAPTMQQDSLAQTLLLTAGFIHRRAPMALLMTARSSGHMQGVSNRLDTSNSRARWLGMIVGTALSSLVDKEGRKMDFGTEEMRSKDALWYMSLIKVHDDLGSLQDFLTLVNDDKQPARRPKRQLLQSIPMPEINGKPTFGPLRPPQKVQTEVEGEKVSEIVEDDSGDNSDDSLKPYAKPDSDPEDSDEDATLVNRHKPRPPVYIRDLLASLRATENADRFQLGLQHAAALIRRKTTFGREVSDHAEELARLLCGLHDPFSTPSFEDQRLQALIAAVLSNPSTLAPWLSRQTFIGEYSLAQRCVMLTALGLSGRELAGLSEPPTTHPSFPSKNLPAHLHALYTPSSSSQTPRLETAHTSLTKTLLQPLATRAEKASTSHLSVLKTRQTSSRLVNPRTTRAKPPNNLSKISAQAYLFPLLTAYNPTANGIWATSSLLLTTLLKTLALLLHASGPATVGLGDVSAELWDALLALRVRALSDQAVLEALLFAFLTVIEVQPEARVLAQEFAEKLVETKGWAEGVFERLGGGGGADGGLGGLMQKEEGGEEAKVRMLAAGVLVRIGEVEEEYRGVLFGALGG